jgi:hypothetical protein
MPSTTDGPTQLLTIVYSACYVIVFREAWLETSSQSSCCMPDLQRPAFRANLCIGRAVTLRLIWLKADLAPYLRTEEKHQTSDLFLPDTNKFVVALAFGNLNVVT